MHCWHIGYFSKRILLLRRTKNICDIYSNNKTTSRVHCVTQDKDDGTVYLYHLDSVYGTYLNKKMISKKSYSKNLMLVTPSNFDNQPYCLSLMALSVFSMKILILNIYSNSVQKTVITQQINETTIEIAKTQKLLSLVTPSHIKIKFKPESERPHIIKLLKKFQVPLLRIKSSRDCQILLIDLRR